MATKIICDICGEEIKNINVSAKVNIDYPNQPRGSALIGTKEPKIYPDVCSSCAEKISRFIEALKGGKQIE